MPLSGESTDPYGAVGPELQVSAGKYGLHHMPVSLRMHYPRQSGPVDLHGLFHRIFLSGLDSEGCPFAPAEWSGEAVGVISPYLRAPHPICYPVGHGECPLRGLPAEVVARSVLFDGRHGVAAHVDSVFRREIEAVAVGQQQSALSVGPGIDFAPRQPLVAALEPAAGIAERRYIIV